MPNKEEIEKIMTDAIKAPFVAPFEIMGEIQKKVTEEIPRDMAEIFRTVSRIPIEAPKALVSVAKLPVIAFTSIPKSIEELEKVRATEPEKYRKGMRSIADTLEDFLDLLIPG